MTLQFKVPERDKIIAELKISLESLNVKKKREGDNLSDKVEALKVKEGDPLEMKEK